MRTNTSTSRRGIASVLSLSFFTLLFLSAAEARAATAWLHTDGNAVRTEDGQLWVGRGANIHDTRGCNACTWAPPDVDEVKRRIDVLVDDWGADFLRLTLESYGSAGGRTTWQDLLNDPEYLADVVEIVDHIGSKPGVYVLVSLWIDPSFTSLGWPTDRTRQEWRLLARTFADDSHVLFGLVNEPQHNYDGALNAEAWDAMNTTVAAIRDVEDTVGARRHLIAVQGLGGWARHLDYYTAHPIEAGGGRDVVYETHVYDPASSFDALFAQPSETLPVIIGEYGPAAGMSMQDTASLQQRALALGIPHLAWTFHGRCPPNLLVDNSGGSCGVDMPLEPTAWGRQLQEHLLASLPAPPTDNEDPAGNEDPVDEPVSSPGYDPAFTLSANCNEWWIEATAGADRVDVETDADEWHELAPTSWGSFAANVFLEQGTVVRLHFTRGDEVARTQWFSFLQETPTLDESEEPPPIEEAPPIEEPTESYDPGLRYRIAKEWWLEVAADADVLTGYLESGEPFTFHRTSWGTFVSDTRPIYTGTRIRLVAHKGALRAETVWFHYLREPMTLR